MRCLRRRRGWKTRALAAEYGVEPDELAARLLDLQAEGEILRIPGEGWAIPDQTDSVFCAGGTYCPPTIPSTPVAAETS